MLLIKVLFAKKKAYNIIFLVLKNEEITLPNEFMFVFTWYFNGAIFSEESSQKWEVLKKCKRGDDHIGWGCLWKGGSNLLHTMISVPAFSFK